MTVILDKTRLTVPDNPDYVPLHLQDGAQFGNKLHAVSNWTVLASVAVQLNGDLLLAHHHGNATAHMTIEFDVAIAQSGQRCMLMTHDMG